MILELYTSVVSCFRVKVITKKYGFVLVLYLFWDISSFKSEKEGYGLSGHHHNFVEFNLYCIHL